jgi:hypothetical protein
MDGKVAAALWKAWQVVVTEKGTLLSESTYQFERLA